MKRHHPLWALPILTLALMGCALPATLFQHLPDEWQEAFLTWLTNVPFPVMASVEEVLRFVWIPAGAFLLLLGWRYRRSGVVIPVLLAGGLTGALAVAPLIEQPRNVVSGTLIGVAAAGLLLAWLAGRRPYLSVFLLGGLSGASLVEIVAIGRYYRPSYQLPVLIGYHVGLLPDLAVVLLGGLVAGLFWVLMFKRWPATFAAYMGSLLVWRGIGRLPAWWLPVIWTASMLVQWALARRAGYRLGYHPIPTTSVPVSIPPPPTPLGPPPVPPPPPMAAHSMVPPPPPAAANPAPPPAPPPSPVVAAPAAPPAPPPLAALGPEQLTRITPSDSDLTGQVLQGRYRVDKHLGRGGMADVYRAWDEPRGVYVALKVLHEDLAHDQVFRRKFRREAVVLQSLLHPNIVRLYSFEEDALKAFLVLEYIQGAPLRAYIPARAGQPFSPGEALTILEPACKALHYGHTQGIYHCDIKPGNILIEEQTGRVLLSDFGIARLAEMGTTTTFTAGTPAYMSPEQCRGEKPDARSDIYALGITLYEMLSGGERPFTGDAEAGGATTAERLRWEHLNQPPPSLRTYHPQLSPEVEQVVLKALRKAPDERYQSVPELLEAFRKAAGTEAQGLRPPSER